MVSCLSLLTKDLLCQHLIFFMLMLWFLVLCLVLSTLDLLYADVSLAVLGLVFVFVLSTIDLLYADVVAFGFAFVFVNN